MRLDWRRQQVLEVAGRRARQPDRVPLNLSGEPAVVVAGQKLPEACKGRNVHLSMIISAESQI
jgi:hypothetical protein